MITYSYKDYFLTSLSLSLQKSSHLLYITSAWDSLQVKDTRCESLHLQSLQSQHPEGTDGRSTPNSRTAWDTEEDLAFFSKGGFTNVQYRSVCVELDHASKAALSSWLYLPLLLHAQVCLLQPGAPLQVRLPASQMAAVTSNSAVKSCGLKFRRPQLTKFYYCVYVGTCLCVYRHIYASTLNHLNKCRHRILLPTGMPVSSTKEL